MVVIMSGMLKRPTASPETAPISAPHASPMMIASQSPRPAAMAAPMVMPAKDATPVIDRSNLRTITTKVTPSAAMPLAAMWRAIPDRLAGDR